MTIRSAPCQDIDLDLRWNITKLGRDALRDSGPTGFPFGGNPVGADALVFRHPFDLLPQGDPAAYCDGGCPDCKEEPPAYLHGYVDGKSKAHFEVRYRTADHDPRVCGCEPCITVRVVLVRLNLWPHGLAATGDANHPDYDGYQVCRGCGGPDDGHFPNCVVQLYEKRREATPDDARRIDQWVTENATVIDPLEHFREGVLALALQYGFPIEDSGSYVYDVDDPNAVYPREWRLMLPYTDLRMPPVARSVD